MNYALLPESVISGAVKGDVQAINDILKHYEGYICRLSTRRLFDKNGKLFHCVDDSLRLRLETKLISKILTFKVA